MNGVTPAYPNHVWGIDITFIRLVHGWLYLVAILDGYSRFVVAWELSETLAWPFVLTADKRALSIATPTIGNHDQGSPLTSPQYTALLLAKEVQINMDSIGRALDHVLTERLWRNVKYEEVYLHDDRSPREARSGLSRYFTFYHDHRLHQSLGYTRHPRPGIRPFHPLPGGGPEIESLLDSPTGWVSGLVRAVSARTKPEGKVPIMINRKKASLTL